jgi:hypothetical protein
MTKKLATVLFSGLIVAVIKIISSQSNRPSRRCRRFLVVCVAVWERTVSAAGGRVLLSRADGAEQTAFRTTQSAMWKYLRPKFLEGVRE